MPFDSKDLAPSEFRKIAIHLAAFDSIRDDVDELFQALGAIKELVKTQCDLLAASDRESEFIYAQARGYTAMSMHVAQVNAIDRRLGEALKNLLDSCPAVRGEKALYDVQTGAR